MNRLIVRGLGVIAAVTLCASMAMAAPPDKKAPAKPAQPQCPVCKMFLASKKTDKSTVAVQLKKGGPVMYCCSKCKMPASVLVKPKTGTKMSGTKMSGTKM